MKIIILVNPVEARKVFAIQPIRTPSLPWLPPQGNGGEEPCHDAARIMAAAPGHTQAIA